jgi:hypothetical protein
MAQEILKEIGLFSEKDSIEADAVADINFFLGDLNFRLDRSYTEHIKSIHLSPELAPKLDQLIIAQREQKVFPGY